MALGLQVALSRRTALERDARTGHDWLLSLREQVPHGIARQAHRRGAGDEPASFLT